jgi:preprotein translocase subunit SecG
MNWAELLVPFFNVVYVVIAVVMIAVILMQRGSGAQAGSSFGAGASGTVFGARGSANFLSRATSVCATLFFLISIGMGIYISHGGRTAASGAPSEGGVMSTYVDPTAAKPVNAELPVGPAGAPTTAPGTVPATAPTPGNAVPVPVAPSPAVPVAAPPQAESQTTTAPGTPVPAGTTPNQ